MRMLGQLSVVESGLKNLKINKFPILLPILDEQFVIVNTVESFIEVASKVVRDIEEWVSSKSI